MERKTNNKPLFIGIAAAGLALIVGLGGFFGGVHYQKSHGDGNSALTAGNSGGPTSFQDGNGGASFGGGSGGGPE